METTKSVLKQVVNMFMSSVNYIIRNVSAVLERASSGHSRKCSCSNVIGQRTPETLYLEQTVRSLMLTGSRGLLRPGEHRHVSLVSKLVWTKEVMNVENNRQLN